MRPLLAGLMLLAPLLLAPAAGAEPPRIQNVVFTSFVKRFALFETRGEVSPQPANPFDPAQIDLQGVFIDPDGGEHRAIGFWYQEYERALVGGFEHLTPIGVAHWRVRFTPHAVGVWTWWWEVRTPEGVASSKPRRLHVQDSGRPGFLRRSARDDRYLAFDDGTSYFAIGENLGWYDGRGTFAYDAWLARLEEQGATYARLWMPSWAFGIEWSDTGLGDYTNRLGRAWQLDRVLTEAERRGMRVMLSLQNHGAFSTRFNSEWAGNPYNAANGGPLTTPGGVFTDPTARAFFQRRLRYVVARWGFSTTILAWELWNEADLVNPYRTAESLAWHREMADWLRALDPHDHLVSTSFSAVIRDPNVWSNAGLDFTQLHFYSTSDVNGDPVTLGPNLADTITVLTQTHRSSYGQPVLFAEIGVDSRGPAETREADPGGIGVHDSLWAGVLSQGFGTAMSWWWDNLIDLEPDLYYPMFGAIARAVRPIRFDREGFEPVDATATTASGRSLVVRGLQGDETLLVWLKDDDFQWYSPDPALIDDAVLHLDPLPAGSWCGRWYDTWAATWEASVSIPGGVARDLAVPAFERDLALRLRRCGS